MPDLIAGTTSNVGIKVFGRNNQSGRIHLFRPGSFRRNAQDKFIVATRSFLGPICKLKIWHDNTGSHPSWNLARISIRDIQTDNVYHFLANCCLSLDPSVGKIEKLLSVAGTQFKRNLIVYYYICFAQISQQASGNLFLNIFWIIFK